MASGLHTRRYLGNAVSPDTAHPTRGDPLELLVLLGGGVRGHGPQPFGGACFPKTPLLLGEGQEQTCTKGCVQTSSWQRDQTPLRDPSVGPAAQTLSRLRPRIKGECGEGARGQVEEATEPPLM